MRVYVMIFALLFAGALIIRQEKQTARQEREATALRKQVEQVAELTEENQRLRRELKSAADAAEANTRELAHMRAEVTKIRQLQRDNERLSSEHEQSAKAASTTRPDGLPYDGFFGPGSNARMHDAMRWGYALIEYANAHQGQLPGSLREVPSFLGPEDFTPEQKAQIALTADQFEVLYHGNREDMTNPPPEGAILIREKQAWQTTSGEWARVYIYGNGHGTVHTEPDGNFEQWEAARLEKSASP